MAMKSGSLLDEMADLLGLSLEESTDGEALARGAHYSRFHFQRMFRQAMGETPGSCQRRLRLERAAYQLLRSQQSITEIAFESGFDSLEGFSRAFRKVAGISPSRFRHARPVSWFFPTPNDIHYDPVLGAMIRLSQQAKQGVTMDLTDILIRHDMWLTRRFLEKAQALSDAKLDEPLEGIGNPLSYLGDEKTLREMLHRLVFTKERWMDSVHGRQENKNPDKSVKGMLERFDSAFGEFVVLARKVRDENLWGTSFMDMVCEPPETFTYGEMIAHLMTFSAYRRTAVIEAFEHFGIEEFGAGDPIEWQRAQNE